MTTRIRVRLVAVVHPFGIGHLQCRNRDSAVRSRDIAGSRHVTRNRRIAAHRRIPTDGRVSDNRQILFDLQVCIHEVLEIGIILAKHRKSSPGDFIQTAEKHRIRRDIALIGPKIWRQIQRATDGRIHLRFDFGHERRALGILAREFGHDVESKLHHTSPQKKATCMHNSVALSGGSLRRINYPICRISSRITFDT